MHLDKRSAIAFGKREEIFPKGYYLYVGSAFHQSGLLPRIRRHLGSVKKRHWHIDFLLDHVSVERVLYAAPEQSIEHIAAEKLNVFPALRVVVGRFGSSDCKCPSHLLYSKEKINIPKLKSYLKKQTGHSFYDLKDNYLWK
jgi:Uri superfamily endonuclease